ncbi:hypothetical protein F5B22DRAFT_605202 [Xylaria bambusicola]|uniref:uncharacterized protein n=1 Tax=Xylaria bambusicola TaxID=326684 RepID=UPI002008D6CF|nr:uncharacterized protein F5B22DRAFT_605202 [Xylaria bambusicola]KAI0517179.1 hypothetical protein F5B22DRAFT_605202 [Xylaria bambusicola]
MESDKSEQQARRSITKLKIREKIAASLDSGSRASTRQTVHSNKSFLGRYLSRKDDNVTKKNQREPPKGPLGLTTLFEPDGQVVADIIFVHGLNGGSRSTWSRTSHGSYWPQDWLSCDDAFQDVRIHTFGYSSGLNRESILNIRDFATNLLACAYHCPAMASNPSGRIIFVGHSMGGLVIKKAYILAHQLPEYDKLASRVHAMFFLATPHQGAGIAQLLNRFLDFAGPRPFVDDLIPQSEMLQTINEEFPRYSDALQLFSFFESQPMFYGIKTGLIVERHCAVMNYANERRTYLDANHRDVARFTTPKDSSYVLVRNALATTVEDQRASLKTEKRGLDHTELEALCRFLGVSGAPEDSLIANESRKLPGSCQWLIQKDSFQRWRDELTSKLFWLQGRPGTGKTMLASHVVNHLHASGLDCCYFYFTYGDEGKETISALLRSMACQMAAIHRAVFTAILNITNSWTVSPVDKVDHVSMWRQVFTSALLRTELKRPQYWIIDAMDECRNSSELMYFLRKAQEVWPLCILITSRTGVETCLSITERPMEIISETILDDNKGDIASFVDGNLQYLPAAARQDISDRILHNARGCFLWVRLVLSELRQVHTATEIDQVLGNDNSDMNTLYIRMLDEMSRAKFGKDLAKAILTWVTCAFRPLTVNEIRLALNAEFQLVDDVERSIGICSNLVFVDAAQKVQLVHLTAREFLTQKTIDSEFIVDESAAHKRLALVCIRTLCGGQENLKKGSGARLLASDAAGDADSVLYYYAATYLFQHLLRLDCVDDEVLAGLASFLGSRRVLFWIEYMANQADLQRVYQAGKICTSLVTRQKKQTPTGDNKQISLIERWGTDLAMLVKKFGNKLNQSPSCIHYLIPPFCPSESILRRQCATPYHGLSLQGYVSKDWDDCVCTIYDPEFSYVQNVVSSATRTAILLAYSTVLIYDRATFLKTNTFIHEEGIRKVAFSQNGKLFATGGEESVRLWDLNSSELITSFQVPARCILIAFIEDDETLLIAYENLSIMYWDITKNVAYGEPIVWIKVLVEEGSPWHSGRIPTMVAFRAEHNLLAIIYQEGDIILRTIDGEQMHMLENDSGPYQHELNGDLYIKPAVSTVAFGSTLENNLLVVAYAKGTVVVFDTDSGELRGSLDQIKAHEIACSPDGRTLAIAAPGCVDIFDLVTLELIHRLQYGNSKPLPRIIAFTPDGLRLLTSGSGQIEVWEPTVPLRRDLESEPNATVSHSVVVEHRGPEREDVIPITAIAYMKDAPQVIYAKEDQTVHIYNISSEPRSQELFTHRLTRRITSLHFDDDSCLLTDISGGRVTSRKLILEAQGKWVASETLYEFNKTVHLGVLQIVVSAKHERLLIRDYDKATLWNIATPNATNYLARVESQYTSTWFSSATNEDFLVRIDDGIVTFYEWKSLTQIRSVGLKLHEDWPVSFGSVICVWRRRHFAKVKWLRSGFFGLRDSRDLPYKAVLPLSTPTAAAEPEAKEEDEDQINPVLNLERLKTIAEGIIGFYNGRIVFIDPDHWVCSIDITPSELTPSTATTAARSSPIQTRIARHFFIPDEWMSLHGIMMEVRPSGDVVVAKRHDLAIIHRGLEFSDKKAISGGSRLVDNSVRSVPRRSSDKQIIA